MKIFTQRAGRTQKSASHFNFSAEFPTPRKIKTNEISPVRLRQNLQGNDVARFGVARVN